MKYTRSRDGCIRATIHVPFRITKGELDEALESLNELGCYSNKANLSNLRDWLRASINDEIFKLTTKKADKYEEG